MTTRSFFLADEAATLAAGQRLAQALSAYTEPQRWIVYLQGNLGAGKTTFSRGLLQALGHRASVKSPTYTLVEPYELAVGAALTNKVYHFDLYRLRDPEELEFLGAQEYFDHAALCLIEWPEYGAGLLPAADLVVALATQDAGRCMSLQPASAAADRLLKQFSLSEK